MELSIFLGIIYPIQIIIAGIIYLLITIFAIYLILKNEKSTLIFLWLLFIIFVPIIGAAIYILKFMINKKPQFFLKK